MTFPRYYELALAVSLILLFTTKVMLKRAVNAGDPRGVRALLLLRLGLSLSACSYLLHLLIPNSPIMHLASSFCTFFGTVLIWTSWLEYCSARRRQVRESSALVNEESGEENSLESASPDGLPRLNLHIQRVLWYALREAHEQHRCQVDTEHLLLGLLQEPRSASGQILRRLKVNPDHIRRALGQTTVPEASSEHMLTMERLPLTDRAQQVFKMAGQEAHRFDKPVVGTEHLLLGLLLIGSGIAAASLYPEGITVDAVRSEIVRLSRASKLAATRA